MVPHPDDTIVALSSAPGPGGRAIVRLSGSTALGVVGRLVGSALSGKQRRFISAQVSLPGVHSPLSADVYVWPAPKTYTGQEMVEIHTLGCPPLVDLLVGE